MTTVVVKDPRAILEANKELIEAAKRRIDEGLEPTPEGDDPAEREAVRAGMFSAVEFAMLVVSLAKGWSSETSAIMGLSVALKIMLTAARVHGTLEKEDIQTMADIRERLLEVLKDAAIEMNVQKQKEGVEELRVAEINQTVGQDALKETTP